ESKDIRYILNEDIEKDVSSSAYPIITKESVANTLRYYSIDTVGNKEEVKVLANIKIDKTKPSTILVPKFPFYQAEGKNYTTSANSYILSASDNISGVDLTKYSINQLPVTSYQSPAIITISEEEKEHSIKYFSTDKAENIEDTKETKIIIDNSSPKTELSFYITSTIDDKYLINDNSEFTLTSTDQGKLPVGVSKIIDLLRNKSVILQKCYNS
ncbi:MAG: hypothetical protein QMD92_08540, partial [bacterium]|nr:hypothetical protein [bacterium]